ncbi:MAG TPA: recombinase family protein [Caldimonas sp.]|jgi:DNA invertase Pin-like site-specific DNA recombinase|nr:recombinase family protein [Caldimonas sp.]HEX2542480.1 recombinase family protein [Caldimonas sp.]
MSERVVSYLRVSTAKQGRSGLGIEAQREAVARYVATTGATLVAEYEEHESGKGSNALEKRPKLAEAIKLAKRRKAVLLIAKLDRLARNVHFVSGLMEQGVEFRCCDFPTADRTMLHIYATMAEAEGRRISLRIGEALRAKKASGRPVGNLANLRPHNHVRAQEAAQFAAKMHPTLAGFVSEGLTQRTMVDRLNQVGSRTPRGGQWGLVQLQRVLARMHKVLAIAA